MDIIADYIDMVLQDPFLSRILLAALVGIIIAFFLLLVRRRKKEGSDPSQRLQIKKDVIEITPESMAKHLPKSLPPIEKPPVEESGEKQPLVVETKAVETAEKGQEKTPWGGVGVKGVKMTKAKIKFPKLGMEMEVDLPIETAKEIIKEAMNQRVKTD